MSTNTSLPGGGSSSQGAISPVGITGLVGLTGPIGITGQLGVTIGNWQSVFGITGSVGVTFPFPTVGITGFVGATIGNFPALFGITGPIGVSVSNLGFGASVSNTGLGVTFPVLSVTFPIGFGVTFNPGVTFTQQQAFGITGTIGTTGTVFVSLGSTLGKTNIFKFGQAAITGNTPSQAFCTYMVSGTKTFYMQSFYIDARFTSLDLTSSVGSTFLGTGALQSPAGTTLALYNFVSTNGPSDRVTITFTEPPTFGPSTVINLVASPGQSTSVTWVGNIMGYER